MTIQEFNELPLMKKATYIWEQGSFADRFDIGPFRALLYLVDDFYAELYYPRYMNKIILMST